MSTRDLRSAKVKGPSILSTKPRILLVYPPFHVSAFADEPQRFGPYNLACLAAYLQDIGQVHIMNIKPVRLSGNLSPEQLHCFHQAVQDFEPDLVGLTAFATACVPIVVDLAQAVKTWRPEVMVVTGGVGASFLADEVLGNGYVDIVVRGEGELAFRELVQSWSPIGVEGLSYRHNGRVIHNADRPLMKNLDDRRFPAIDLVDWSGVDAHLIETSRGCTMRCTFCCTPSFYGFTQRTRSPARVVEEIKYLMRYHETSYFMPTDENIAGDVDWLTTFCELLLKEELSLNILSQARADDIARSPELVPLMVRAGFSVLLLGLESGNPQTLKKARKGLKLDRVKTAVKLLQENGIFVLGSFIIGFPHETPEMMEQTADFAIELDVDVAGFNILTPHPGTPLYEQCQSENLLLTKDWTLYDRFNQLVKTPGWPEVNVESIQAQLKKRFYFRSEWIQSRLSAPGEFHYLLSRGMWRTPSSDADRSEEWQQIVVGYSSLITACCSEDFFDYRASVQFETELEEMSLQIEGGGLTFHNERVDAPDLIVKTSNRALNRLIGQMDMDAFSAFLLGEVRAEGTVQDMVHFIRWIDAVQDVIAMQWPSQAVDNPVCLPALNRLMADNPRLDAGRNRKRRNILFTSDVGNLLVRVQGHRVTALRLMAAGESAGKRVRNLEKANLKNTDLANILQGDLACLAEGLTAIVGNGSALRGNGRKRNT